MPKRIPPDDVRTIVGTGDVDDVVLDKREGWRASPAKARRRHRRYARLPTSRPIIDCGKFGIVDTGGGDPYGPVPVRLEGQRENG